MKTTEKLANIIKEAFEYNKDAETLIVTEDGHCFLPEAKNHAVNHAYKTGVKYFEVKKGEKLEVIKTTSKKQSAGIVSDEMTVAELKAFAEEKGIALESTKKQDIINEINQKLNSNE